MGPLLNLMKIVVHAVGVKQTKIDFGMVADVSASGFLFSFGS